MCKFKFTKDYPTIEGYWLYRKTDPETGFKCVDLTTISRSAIETPWVFKYYIIEWAGPVEIEGEQFPVAGLGPSRESEVRVKLDALGE